ncbi:YqgFc domain-containing protein [Citrus sinensis]|uniref:YqgF/RNase H-like domain-containing protein n=2 Tax=Citrus sinensis TaxID=2711 RepID=A0A067H486_CITSI|nr:YqgFc domain-containing protein [Citrus sinensis]KAH9788449.1 YqgFc domain-containing protein [Citrus sinensis]KDO85704.1 hypothetical protein CISIN_1g026881mg [Citrus sinensis]KDO85705.1 hypothetical protein CISIN_1g026881mg [Citrus sinensis]
MCSLQSQHFLNSPLLIFPKFNDNRKFHLNRTRNFGQRIGALSSVEEFLPNATRRKKDSLWRGGFSLGVDLGLSRTGLALSKGFCVRPLTVLKLRGEKLELQLLEIAQREETDEFIIGLPKSWDGSETPQSNKVRSVAGRLAVRAAERSFSDILITAIFSFSCHFAIFFTVLNSTSVGI